MWAAVTTAWGDVLYYGNLAADSPTLKNDLFTILTSAHVRTPPANDTLAKKCSSSASCFQYAPQSYDSARKYLFGGLHLEGTDTKSYSLYTYYCSRRITNNDLSPKIPLAPLKIPDSKVINTEHVWPQSRFSKKFPERDQKPNLHILFPEESRVNSTRSNHPMGIVTKPTSTPCPQARLGKNTEGQTVFEPSDAVKGDVARAMFYFSVRFQLTIDDVQENILRQWHENDPPDEFEIWRNDAIFEIQKDRNPFIDKPELVGNIADF